MLAFAVALPGGLASPADPGAKPAAAWDPAKTFVFAVSATEWKYDHKLNMPKKGRHDIDLIAAFKARGVPADQVVFLKDGQGTLAAIRKAFSQVLGRTRPGDTLVFYFQGHGGRDLEKGRSRYYFVNYDAHGNDQKTYFYVSQLFDALDADFKGGQVLLTADCCYSGGLAEEAKRRKGKYPCACLTSVNAHNSSTGNWTYTDALIQGLKGEAVVDLDGDGTVTLEELHTHTDRLMAVAESQRAGFRVLDGFDARWQLSKARAKGHAEVGKFLEAKQDGTWYRAQVVDVKGDKVKVAYLGYNETEWVARDRLREFHPKEHPAGTKLQAKDDNDQWHPATVKEAFYGLHLIHFDHDKTKGGVLDEWVAPDRLKVKP
jgi:hypothetical protein